jgi:hypothetical protein
MFWLREVIFSAIKWERECNTSGLFKKVFTNCFYGVFAYKQFAVFFGERGFNNIAAMPFTKLV